MGLLYKIRLDQFLVDQNYYSTKSRARDAVIRGCVCVSGIIVAKPGAKISSDVTIELNDAAKSYVSRSALKLAHAIDVSQINAADKSCLDIGASTGGFTQILLEQNAKIVFALDVGHGQLDHSLSSDPRVVELSGVNSKNITLELLNGIRPEIIVCDISFISLTKALPRALELAASGAQGIFLIKPQFEVGPQHIAKNGLVKDQNVGFQIAEDVCKWVDNSHGWNVVKMITSPITGGDGNREYLAIAEKTKD